MSPAGAWLFQDGAVAAGDLTVSIDQGATCWVMPAEPSEDPPSTDTTIPETTVPG